MMLQIELVPSTAWFSNLRSELSAAEWERVKAQTFKNANYRCEVCQGIGPKHPVECHEVWDYDEKGKTQTLMRTIALCPNCHASVHYGLSRVLGREKKVRKHLMTVNGWDEKTLDAHVNDANNAWRRRNSITWVLNAKWLISFIELGGNTRKKIFAHAKGELER